MKVKSSIESRMVSRAERGILSTSTLTSTPISSIQTISLSLKKHSRMAQPNPPGDTVPYLNCRLHKGPGARAEPCSICIEAIGPRQDSVTHKGEDCKRTWHKECIDVWKR